MIPNGPASQQKLGPADDVANDAQLLGWPRYLTTGRKGDPVSNWKAWSRRDDARFRLQPASPIGRPSQGGTTLAFDFGLPLQPKVHRTSTYSSSSTIVVGADWVTTERGRLLGKNPKNQAEQVRQDSQVNHNTKDRTLHTCRTVLSGHVRRELCNLPDVSEHEQCYGRRHLPYSMVGVDIGHTERS